MSENETAAAYIRVSTEKQKEEESHIRQRERMNEWAEENGIDELDHYEDIAISGQSEERDAYDELMDDYDDYDYVVVRELSRFGRDPVKVLNDVEEIAESEGVEFVSVTEPMLDTTSAHGKLMVRLIASINGFHADLRREQAQRMVERRREKGLPIGRPKKLNDEQLAQVYEWREANLSYNDISRLVELEYDIEIDQSTIYRYCNAES